MAGHLMLDLNAECTKFITQLDSQVDKDHLKAAFIAGAIVMANDTIDCLRDHATFLAGVKVPLYTSEQCYDNVADELEEYYSEILATDSDKE